MSIALTVLVVLMVDDAVVAGAVGVAVIVAADTATESVVIAEFSATSPLGIPLVPLPLMRGSLLRLNARP